MKARDVMTAGIISIKPDTLVIRAAELMLRYDISGFPVVERSGKLVGIVTEGDLLKRAETGTERMRTRHLALLLEPGRLAAEYVRAHGSKVEEVMSRDVAVVSEEAPLDEVVAVMEARHVKRVPVMRGGAVVGIVSRRDLLHALVVSAKKAVPPLGGDGAIRDRVLAELERQAWLPPAPITVSVADGVVELRGFITDERQREALRVLAENVPGVKAVRDWLVWLHSF